MGARPILRQRLRAVARIVGRRLLVENPSGSLRFRQSPIPEPEFLSALARRTEVEEPGPIAFGDIRYDPESREIAREGERIRLTAREGALFELLLRRRGKVVSRSEIQARIWEDSFDLSTNIIDVYINALRKKIDAGGREKVIHTVRGVGYLVRAAGSEE